VRYLDDHRRRPVDHNNVLACRVADTPGELTEVFYGHPSPVWKCGSRIRLRGITRVGPDGRMINLHYELLR
jgi:hypothetical protein